MQPEPAELGGKVGDISLAGLSSPPQQPSMALVG